MVAITVAGIIATILIGARNAVKRGAKAMSKFAKALAKVGKKAAPGIGGLLDLTAKLLSLGADAVGLYGMCDFEYRITLPKPEKIMKAQTNEAVGEYKLTDMHLEYEIIESEDLAERVRGEYNVGRSLG